MPCRSRPDISSAGQPLVGWRSVLAECHPRRRAGGRVYRTILFALCGTVGIQNHLSQAFPGGRGIGSSIVSGARAMGRGRRVGDRLVTASAIGALSKEGIQWPRSR